MRPFGWRKDRLTLNKREAEHLRKAVPRILAGVSPLTLAQEWNKRGIKTVTGAPWRAATIRNMFFRLRICGYVTHHGDILRDENDQPVRAQWEPIITEDQYAAVKRAWSPAARGTGEQSRLGAKGRGYRTIYLLSPFVRCGKCNARMIGSKRKDARTGELVPIYRCQAKGAGGCSGVSRVAEPIDTYIKALEALSMGLPITAICKWYHRRAIHCLRTLLPEAEAIYALTFEPVYSNVPITRTNWMDHPDGKRRVIREWQEVERRVADGSYLKATHTGDSWR